MKILAFAASNSQSSINHALVTYTKTLIDFAEVEIIRINDFELPLFSVDIEASIGQPEPARQFFEKMGEADAILISFAEHNGSYTAAYKNLFDWTSRIDQKVFQGKPMVLLATSPGKRGASNVLAIAKDAAPHFGGEVKADFSLPSFFENFDLDTGKVTNEDLDNQLRTALMSLS